MGRYEQQFDMCRVCAQLRLPSGLFTTLHAVREMITNTCGYGRYLLGVNCSQTHRLGLDLCGLCDVCAGAQQNQAIELNPSSSQARRVEWNVSGSILATSGDDGEVTAFIYVASV